MATCSQTPCTAKAICKGLCNRHYGKHWRNSESGKAYAKTYGRYYRPILYSRIKEEVLSHYSPNDKPQCSWPDCSVTDIDMLSLDHVNNDGHVGKVKGKARTNTGTKLYHRVKRDGFPDDYQTLCHNHQWKKEILRRRTKQQQ